MKIAYECLTCLLGQSIAALKMVTDDITMQQNIIKNSLEKISQLNFTETAPYFGRLVH